MNTFTCRVSVLAGLLAGSGACAAIATGCGGNTSTSTSEDGGTDSTTDSSEDVAQQSETGAETGTSDTAAGPDAGGDGDATVGSDGDAAFVGDVAAADGDATLGSDGDAGIGAESDSGTDVLTVAADTGSDADASPTPDASDAGPDGDAGVGPALNGETFPAMVATAYCSAIAECCGTSGDASTFKWETCYNTFLPGGYGGSTVGAQYFDAGNITFNAAAAQTCLDTLAAADCTTNQVTSTDQVTLYHSCYGAYAGILEGGSPCMGSIECTPGNYCLPVDGGVPDSGATGLCQPLAGDGGGCGFLGNSGNGQGVCSYRGSGSNGMWCQSISGDAGTTLLPSSEWTCQPQWPNGSECFGNQSCESFICHLASGSSALQCGAVGNWANSSTCATYDIPADAGGGG
jgi:hypothetical protein